MFFVCSFFVVGFKTDFVCESSKKHWWLMYGNLMKS